MRRRPRTRTSGINLLTPNVRVCGCCWPLVVGLHRNLEPLEASEWSSTVLQHPHTRTPQESRSPERLRTPAHPNASNLWVWDVDVLLLDDDRILLVHILDEVGEMLLDVRRELLLVQVVT